MKIRSRIALLCLCCALAVLSASATKILKRWTITGMTPPTLTRILVIGLTDNYIVRQYFEDEMEKRLAREGAVGIKGHMVLPPRNEMSEAEIRERIRTSQLDAVLIARPIGVRREAEQIITSMVYVPGPGYYNMGPYWNTAYAQVYTSGYMQEYAIAQVETNIYGAHDEKLVWSGLSETFASDKFESIAKDLAGALVSQLKRDKLLPKK